MSKKILLTGYSGFIGQAVLNELLARGYEVVGLYNQHCLPEMIGLTQIQLDLFDFEKVDSFLSKNQFEHLIHLAWYLGPKCHISNINISWVSASLHLIESFHKFGGANILCNGTVSEYDFSYGYLSEELTPLTNKSLHGKCKSSLFTILSSYCQQNNIDFKWARVFNLYGPHEKTNRLVPSVINCMLKNQDVKVSNCAKIQDYLHVYDTASGIVDLFESNVLGAVNICSGTPIKLRTIVEKIAEIISFKGEILWGSIPTSFEDSFIVGNNEKLLNQVGWQQKISLEDGLKLTIDWWKNHNER
ncbi:NAD(P)-dependent oxidoreductase [Orbaceae bacterium ESL0721]|nr:NAD(P)-dependent oxidoreductase [Orbaceae bacterium ESL0721]